MGLSRLSEKCQKCNRKDTCDKKRMEACGYIMPKFDGGIVDTKGLFIEREGQPELVGRIGDNSRIFGHEPILESLADACEKAFKDALKEDPDFKIDLFCRPRELR